jgi:hypothetical protein
MTPPGPAPPSDLVRTTSGFTSGFTSGTTSPDDIDFSSLVVDTNKDPPLPDDISDLIKNSPYTKLKNDRNNLITQNTKHITSGRSPPIDIPGTIPQPTGGADTESETETETETETAPPNDELMFPMEGGNPAGDSGNIGDYFTW